MNKLYLMHIINFLDIACDKTMYQTLLEIFRRDKQPSAELVERLKALCDIDESFSVDTVHEFSSQYQKNKEHLYLSLFEFIFEKLGNPDTIKNIYSTEFFLHFYITLCTFISNNIESQSEFDKLLFILSDYIDLNDKEDSHFIYELKAKLSTINKQNLDKLFNDIKTRDSKIIIDETHSWIKQYINQHNISDAALFIQTHYTILKKIILLAVSDEIKFRFLNAYLHDPTGAIIARKTFHAYPAEYHDIIFLLIELTRNKDQFRKKFSYYLERISVVENKKTLFNLFEKLFLLNNAGEQTIAILASSTSQILQYQIKPAASLQLKQLEQLLLDYPIHETMSDKSALIFTIIIFYTVKEVTPSIEWAFRFLLDLKSVSIPSYLNFISDFYFQEELLPINAITQRALEVNNAHIYLNAGLVDLNDDEAIKKFFNLVDFPNEIKNKLILVISHFKKMAHVIEGPLQKTYSTLTLEALLLEIINMNLKNIKIISNIFNDIIIYLGSKPPINLTTLLKNANLSQIHYFDQEPHETTNKKIANIILYFLTTSLKLDLSVVDINSPSPLFQKLSRPHQIAINLYTTKLYYENMNKLLRGEFFSTDKNEILTLLLLSLLTASALNQLSLILHDPDVYTYEKSLLKKLKLADPTLDLRSIVNLEQFKALLNSAVEKNTITEAELSELKNAYHFIFPLLGGVDSLRRDEYYPSEEQAPSTTSYQTTGFTSTTSSQEKLTSLSPQSYSQNRTLFFNRNNLANLVSINSISVTKGEDEIILPPKQHFLLSRESDSTYAVQIVRSPALIQDHYWSDVALEKVSEEHLFKPYQDTPDEKITHNEITIYRPNHGLAHTYRVMLYVPLIINYFGFYANDPAFAEFCQFIDPEDLELLLILAAYSVSGRESEFPSQTHPKQTKLYRQRCNMFLDEFLDLIPKNYFSQDISKIKARCHDVMEHMGHPKYEIEFNQEMDPNEKQIRDFYHRVLSMAHTIDLPRCWTANTIDNYEKAIGYYNQFITPSIEQEIALYECQQYACNLIELHGDMMQFTITAPNHYQPVNKSYSDKFFELSHSISALTRISERIDKPVFGAPHSSLQP